MVTCVTGLLASLAIPHLNNALRGADAVTASRQLHLHMALARSTAITRREHVVLCPAFSDPSVEQCDDTTQWTQGWWVFVDADRDQEIGDDDVLIAWGQPLRKSVQVRQGRSDWARALRFKPTGAAWPNTSFLVCTGANTKQSRRVVLYRSGRARITRVGAFGCDWIDSE